jgi:hypothetical protein
MEHHLVFPRQRALDSKIASLKHLGEPLLYTENFMTHCKNESDPVCLDTPLGKELPDRRRSKRNGHSGGSIGQRPARLGLLV